MLKEMDGAVQRGCYKIPGQLLILVPLLAWYSSYQGYFLKNKPPKGINALYGYRTFRSMKNIDLWKEANQYSSKS
jgi:hypothetical protein